MKRLGVFPHVPMNARRRVATRALDLPRQLDAHLRENCGEDRGALRGLSGLVPREFEAPEATRLNCAQHAITPIQEDYSVSDPRMMGTTTGFRTRFRG